MSEENHGWTVGWTAGGAIAGLLFAWPASCVDQGPLGAQRVEYDSWRETSGQVECTNVLGLPRVDLDQLQTVVASLMFGVLLGALYELYLWWHRSQARP